MLGLRSILLSFLMLLASYSLHAEISVDQLVEAGEFKIRAEILPKEPIVPGQELSLIIELATNRWFAGGTKIEIPEMENMLVIQRDEFAVNSTRNETGQTWVVQTWELSLFPQQQGLYETSPVILDVSVNTEQFGIVKGKVVAPSLMFKVMTPEALNEIQYWVVSTSLTVERTFDKSLENLAIGDAIQEIITVKGENLLAMMLPEYKPPNIDGLAVYSKIPELINHNQRGDRSAERIQRIDYIVEREGQFSIPTQTFYWWNSESNSLETILISGVDFAVGSGIISEEMSNLRNSIPSNVTSSKWFLIIAIFLMVGLIVLIVVRYQRGSNKQALVNEKYVLRCIQRCVAEGDAPGACRWLYVWLDHFANHENIVMLRSLALQLDSPEFSQQVELALRKAYAKDQISSSLELTIPVSRFLWFKKIACITKPSKIDLRLNL